MYQKTANGDKNLTTASGEWKKECFDDSSCTTSKGNKMLWIGLSLLLLTVLLVAWMMYKNKK